MIVPEGTVLRPKDPGIEDDNEWPEFKLKKARVYERDGRTLTSLLTAANKSGLVVRGQLAEIDSDQDQYVLNGSFLDLTIQISEVKRYAYGQYPDGGIGIWAEGKAGWFLIEPARNYKAIYDDMVEAIDILYFLVDNHRKGKSRRGSTKEQCRNLFSKYIEHSNYRYDDTDEAAQVFDKHREFLILTMLSGKEGINWLTQPIFNFMKQKSPDDFVRIKAKFDWIHNDERSNGAEADDCVPINIDPASQTHGAVRSRIRIRSDSETSLGKRHSPEDAELDSQGADGDRKHKKRKRKSILRPKGSKSAGKGTAANASASAASHEDEEEDGDDDENSTTTDLAPPTQARVNLRGIQIAKSVTETTKHANNINAKKDPTHSVSEGKSSRRLSSRTSVHIHKENPPSPISLPSPPASNTYHTPQGPGDTWTCTVADGCNYKVYQASKSTSQEMITEHLQLHEDSLEKARDKLELVQREGGPGLPIGNLLGKIQRIAGGGHISLLAASFPSPVRRRY